MAWREEDRPRLVEIAKFKWFSAHNKNRGYEPQHVEEHIKKLSNIHQEYNRIMHQGDVNLVELIRKQYPPTND